MIAKLIMKLLEISCYIICIFLIIVIILAIVKLGYMAFAFGLASIILHNGAISIGNMKEQ